MPSAASFAVMPNCLQPAGPVPAITADEIRRLGDRSACRGDVGDEREILDAACIVARDRDEPGEGARRVIIRVARRLLDL
jgi:hypothetical protein